MYLKKPLKLRKKESINPWNINTGKEIPLVHPSKNFSRPTALNFEERTRLQSQQKQKREKTAIIQHDSAVLTLKGT